VRERDAEAWATPEAWAKKMGHIEIQAILEWNLEQNLEQNSGSI